MVDGDLNAVGMPGQGLINRVVYHLFDHMVQAIDIGWTNVHAWSLTYSIEPFQYGDLAGIVALRRSGKELVIRHSFLFVS